MITIIKFRNVFIILKEKIFLNKKIFQDISLNMPTLLHKTVPRKIITFNVFQRFRILLSKRNSQGNHTIKPSYSYIDYIYCLN